MSLLFFGNLHSNFIKPIINHPQHHYGYMVLVGLYYLVSQVNPLKLTPMAHPAQVSSLAARLSEMQSESGESAAQSAAESAAEVRGLHWILTPRPFKDIYWGVYSVHPLKIYQNIHFAVSEFILFKMSVWVTRRYTQTCRVPPCLPCGRTF